MRKKIAAGNWKMNTNLVTGQQLASEVINMIHSEVDTQVQVILIPPYFHITGVKKLIGPSENIFLGAQNVHHEDGGAYTGEISAEMLQSCGVSHVVVGHSERREYFGEDEALLSKKVRKVLDFGMTPIFCCGEKLEVREQDKHFDLIKKQVEGALFGLSREDIKKVVIAYEPVWAIGTGVTASSAQAQEMHAFIRELLAEKYDQSAADDISILYGGSVKPDNARELFACPDVDGGLVGGASLKSRDFTEIAKSF